ncbi:hypothetical protein Pan181_29500 [Aeoliella mucimassa]|uniref:Uncharacterized protein n=1 Tax=Aeoliella mucimassa TaxID=2527972 RepID=A0A518APT6_9BACT|nr:hypothetical protein Pan181_29500 [Aeoliella mucimassa]
MIETRKSSIAVAHWRCAVKSCSNQLDISMDEHSHQEYVEIQSIPDTQLSSGLR